MKEITIQTIKDFKKFVDEMQVNTKYLLPDNFRYKWVKVEYTKEHFTKQPYFSWGMEYNHKVAKLVGYIYPISSGNKVTHFKTEKGAKNNFYKKYAYYFEPLCSQ